MSRRGSGDWGALGTLFGLLLFAALFAGVVAWVSQQPTCWGIEPDGEVETLWPCPVPGKDGQRFPVTEDQFADYEIGGDD